MKNAIKDIFYIGVCTAAVTKHFVEAEVKRYLDAGNISAEEGKKIVDKAMKQVHKRRLHLEKALKTEVKRGIKEAKPLIKESEALVKEIAADVLSEAKKAAKGKARNVATRVKKKIASSRIRLTNVRKKVRKLRSNVAKARKIVKKIRKRR